MSAPSEATFGPAPKTVIAGSWSASLPVQEVCGIIVIIVADTVSIIVIIGQVTQLPVTVGVYTIIVYIGDANITSDATVVAAVIIIMFTSAGIILTPNLGRQDTIPIRVVAGITFTVSV